MPNDNSQISPHDANQLRHQNAQQTEALSAMRNGISNLLISNQRFYADEKRERNLAKRRARKFGKNKEFVKKYMKDDMVGDFLDKKELNDIGKAKKKVRKKKFENFTRLLADTMNDLTSGNASKAFDREFVIDPAKKVAMAKAKKLKDLKAQASAKLDDKKLKEQANTELGVEPTIKPSVSPAKATSTTVPMKTTPIKKMSAKAPAEAPPPKELINENSLNTEKLEKKIDITSVDDRKHLSSEITKLIRSDDNREKARIKRENTLRRASRDFSTNEKGVRALPPRGADGRFTSKAKNTPNATPTMPSNNGGGGLFSNLLGKTALKAGKGALKLGKGAVSLTTSALSGVTASTVGIVAGGIAVAVGATAGVNWLVEKYGAGKDGYSLGDAMSDVFGDGRRSFNRKVERDINLAGEDFKKQVKNFKSGKVQSTGYFMGINKKQLSILNRSPNINNLLTEYSKLIFEENKWRIVGVYLTRMLADGDEDFDKDELTLADKNFKTAMKARIEFKKKFLLPTKAVAKNKGSEIKKTEIKEKSSGGAEKSIPNTTTATTKPATVTIPNKKTTAKNPSKSLAVATKTASDNGIDTSKLPKNISAKQKAQILNSANAVIINGGSKSQAQAIVNKAVANYTTPSVSANGGGGTAPIANGIPTQGSKTLTGKTSPSTPASVIVGDSAMTKDFMINEFIPLLANQIVDKQISEGKRIGRENHGTTNPTPMFMPELMM